MRIRCSSHPARCRAFTLGEVLWVIVVLAVLAAFLFPVFARRHGNYQESDCQSNLKQIGLALMQYQQDDDDLLPPAVGPSHAINGGLYRRDWGANQVVDSPTRPRVVLEGMIQPYVKSDLLFQCLEVARGNGNLPLFSYRYNDLAAGKTIHDFRSPEMSVLVTDGEIGIHNAGHAYTPDAPPQPATFDTRGRCGPGRGATVRAAATRHSGGANFLFADGHVKWLRPTYVYWPSRDSDNPSHLDGAKHPVGPDPAGAMTFGGHGYAATFQIR